MTENKYKQGKVYALRSSETDECYIGSTIEPLNERFRRHGNHFIQWLSGMEHSHYITSFELLKFDDCKIELIKDYPCNSKTELEREEGKYIREIDCVNKCIAGRTHKEYYEEHKEQIDAYRKQWAKDNKEHLKLYKAELYQKNKEEIRKKDNLKNQAPEMKEKNLVRAKAYSLAKSEIIECECGSSYKKFIKAQHLKCKKHQDFINGVERPPLKPNQKECECGSRHGDNTSDRNQHFKSKKHIKWLETQEE